MLDRTVFSCQQNGVNTFYKCIEFQVNSFDSYWEILIILKQYPKFLCTMLKQRQISMYNFVNCLQFNIRYEKVERPASVGGALVILSLILIWFFFLYEIFNLQFSNRSDIPGISYGFQDKRGQREPNKTHTYDNNFLILCPIVCSFFYLISGMFPQICCISDYFWDLRGPKETYAWIFYSYI